VLEDQRLIPAFLAIVILLGVRGQSLAAEIQVPSEEPTIQSGIDAAAPGDVIVVAPGSYNESIDFRGKAVEVRSVDPGDPSVVMGTVINAMGFVRAVTFANSEGSSSVLSGFVITGGNATGSVPNDRGGGMYIIGASPKIERCTFAVNQALNGGAVYVSSGAPTFRGCLFSGNGAAFGGAVFGESANATFENVTFCSNTATNYGGHAYGFNGDTSTYSKCTFSAGTASLNGGGLFSNGVSPIVVDTGFCGNVPNAIAGSSITDQGGNSFQFCAPPSSSTTVATAVALPRPGESSLSQNHPNPFNPRTRIRFQLREDSRVELKIYDASGRLVETVLDEFRVAGQHQVSWSGRDESGAEVASGVYFYTLSTSRGSESAKMTLLR
jgi:hypothetical protein